MSRRSIAECGFILAESYIKHPVEAIFDGPVQPDCLGENLGCREFLFSPRKLKDMVGTQYNRGSSHECYIR